MDDEEEDDIFFFREIENNIYMYFQFLEKMMWTFNKKIWKNWNLHDFQFHGKKFMQHHTNCILKYFFMSLVY